MTSRNHPNPEALYPVMKRHEVLLLVACEKDWKRQTLLPLAACGVGVGLELLEQWEANGLVEVRTVRNASQQNFIEYLGEYRATRSGKFVVKGWREAGWIE